MSQWNRGRSDVHGSRTAIYLRKFYVILSYHGLVWSHHSNFFSKWIQYQSKDKSGLVQLQQKSLYCEATDTRLGGYVKTMQIYEANNINVSTLVDAVHGFLGEYKLIKRTFLFCLHTNEVEHCWKSLQNIFGHVQPLFRNCAWAYDCLYIEEFHHLRVNHSINFINPQLRTKTE